MQRDLERRRHPRQACQMTLTSRVGVYKASVTVCDISSTGARLQLPAGFVSGREIILSDPQRAGSIRAQVVWLRRNDDGSALAGVHFLEKPERLRSSWLGRYLKTPRNLAAVDCNRPVRMRPPGAPAEEARLLRLEGDGARLLVSRHLHLSSRLSLEIPYDQGTRSLWLSSQVVHRHRRPEGWLVTVQFLIADRGRERAILARALSQLKKEQGQP